LPVPVFQTDRAIPILPRAKARYAQKEPKTPIGAVGATEATGARGIAIRSMPSPISGVVRGTERKTALAALQTAAVA